jgi:arsenite transporter
MFKKTPKNHQIGIYLSVVVLASFVTLPVPGTTILETGINPAHALMWFVTFLQIPLGKPW